MKSPHLAILLCLAILSASGTSYAEERPIEQAYSLQFGYQSILDTYLSPLRYGGERVALTGSWGKAMPCNPRHLRMQFDASIEGAFTSPASGVHNLYHLGLDFGWHMQYQWQLPHDITLGAGGGAKMEAGCIYLPSNTNNPASARAALDLTLDASASWQTHIGRVPMRLSDRVSLPSAGIFFSPQFGESYYEIWLGNRSGLVHPGWWGNRFCIYNLLSADLLLGRRSLRIGYAFAVRSSYVCDINTQLISHCLVAGIVF